MMRLNRNHLFWARVWLCVGAAISLAVCVYAALIHPSVVLVLHREESELQRQTAEMDYLDAVSELETIQARIEKKRQRLETLGGAPPLETREDIVVTHLTNLAVSDGISIEQFAPLDSIDAENHRAFFVQFKAHGDFGSFYRFLKRIETQVDFVDITHLSVTRVARLDESPCMIEWSCRINTRRVTDGHGRARETGEFVASTGKTGEGRHAP